LIELSSSTRHNLVIHALYRALLAAAGLDRYVAIVPDVATPAGSGGPM
jgi:hypothetical protein